MFRLEKLEISGFKSFADKTTLVFGEGITGVVGPNGCGKSNVAEAISWVLGEQSAKNLRGGKMEDVIFNGTRDRKPTGMAEVLLSMIAVEDIAARDPDDDKEEEQDFDEALSAAERAAETARNLVEELAPPQVEADASSDQSGSTEYLQTRPDSPAETSESPAPVDTGEGHAKRRRSPRLPKRRRIAVAAGERIVVGRRLYRTGDSDYLMNGKACLLRDIQDLFAGTGLGGAHYAIIEQGRIGQILSSKPLDRRALIEEAAGITKFKSRKRTTELKLDSAKQNLTRLNDIISEIERQVNSLKRQAQKARRYRRLRDEMRKLLKIVFTADYRRLNEAIETIARDLTQAELTQSELDARLVEREGQHRGASTAARAAEDSLAGQRERHAAVELEADRARNRRAFDQQNLDELSARVQEIEANQKQLDERLALIQDSAEQRAGAVHRLESDLTAEQAECRRREEAFQEQTLRVREAETRLEQLRQQMLAAVGNTERLRNLAASLDDSFARIEMRKASLDAESQRASGRLAEVNAEHTQLAWDIEHQTTQLAELNARISGCAARLEQMRSGAAETRAHQERVSSERAAAEHRLRSLEDLDAHRAYYSDAVQQVLGPEQASRINALGTLADFVDVEPQYERLIESLFSRELQCVLVPTIDDALAGVEYIKGEGLGRGAFLVVGLHGGEGEPVHGGANDDKEDGRSTAQFTSSTEGDVPTVNEEEPMEHPLNAAENTVPDYVLEPPRAVTWPLIAERPAEAPPKFELEVLRAVDLLGLRPGIKSVVERAFPAKCAAAVVPDIEAALQLSIENSARIYVSSAGEQVVNGRLIVTGARAGQQGTSLLGLKRELKDLRICVDALVEKSASANAEREAMELALRSIESEAAVLDGEHHEHEKQAAARRSRFDSLTQELERARQHVRVVEADLAQVAVERGELESRIVQATAELQTAEASRQSVQTALDQLQSSLVTTRSEAERLAESLSESRSGVAALTERLSAGRSELRRLETEAEELRSRINRNRLELYDSHGRIEQLTASLAEGEGVVSQLEGERQELAGQISLAGEALAAARSRVDELERELADLRQAAAAAHDRRGQIEVERARTQAEAQHLSKDCLSELSMSIEDVVTSVELSLSLEGESAAGDSLEDAGEGACGFSADQTSSSSSGAEEQGTMETSPTITGRILTAEEVDNARARLAELRTRLDDMGPVNLMALEELEQCEGRFQFLSGQRADILDSIRMTEEALSEIKRRSRERFRHAFQHINANFQQMFVELFGGGRGEMMLIDEDDVLESGVDLIAQPPGKRLQNVLLLSGGEKAMAAIALVLAIFQYRPSPFCILDEVDAPLDEVNVGRFSDKVIEMSRETQFLMITHNKRTMEAARALYGVTMEEPGVSKLVSVMFE